MALGPRTRRFFYFPALFPSLASILLEKTNAKVASFVISASAIGVMLAVISSSLRVFRSDILEVPFSRPAIDFNHFANQVMAPSYTRLVILTYPQPRPRPQQRRRTERRGGGGRAAKPPGGMA